jgi:hypothetical protein
MEMSAAERRVRFIISERKKAYTSIFNNVNAEAVLADLDEFCRMDESTFNPDPRIHALLEGRREVALRIKHYLTRTEDELFEITKRK